MKKVLTDVEFQSKTLPLPNCVQIQTTSFCNGFCRICPYYKMYDKVEMGMMSDELFEKIIDDCVTYGIKKIIPYLFNEPLLDPKMIERINYIRKKIPDADIQISTNGSMLNKETAEELVESGLNELRISIHSLNKERYSLLTPGLKFEKVLENLKYFVSLKRPITLKVYLTPVIVPDVNEKDIDVLKQFAKDNKIGIKAWPFWDRAGNVDFKCENILKKEIAGCGSNRDTERIHVLFNGNVILCCMDWFREVNLGKLDLQTIKDCWTSPAYQAIRKKIKGLTKTNDSFLCKKCICSKEK